MPFFLFAFAIPSMVFFLRFLMQYTSCDYYNPACRTIATITAPFLGLTNKVAWLKSRHNIHWGALLWTVILGEIGFCSYFIIGSTNFTFQADNIIFIVAASFLFTIWAIVNLLFYLLIACAILSWIPSLTQWSMLLRQLTSPIIAPLDRIIPPIGMISLSFMAGFFLMSLVNYTALPFLISKLLNLLSGVL